MWVIGFTIVYDAARLSHSMQAATVVSDSGSIKQSYGNLSKKPSGLY